LHIVFRRFFGAGFVYLLNRLKRENDVADLVGFSVPDELDFAFIFKQ